MHVNDHEFTVEVDIVQMDKESERVVINGYLGDKIKARYHEDRLVLEGSEASISVLIDKEELASIIENQ